MVDFDKTYKVDIDTSQAVKNVKALARTFKDVDKQVKETKKDFKAIGKTAEREVGKKAKKALDSVAKSAARARMKVRSVSDELKRVGKSASDFGRKMTMRFTLPVIGAGAASVKFAMDLNKSMATVATLIPRQGERVKELKKNMQDLSVESGKSTDDLTAGLYDAISAWGDGADTLERLKVVVKASQAGLASTSETLGLMATITENYGDNSAEAVEHTADLAFVTNKLAKKAPFAEMAASLGKVVPLAAQLNVSQEDLFATMTAGAGITGNVAEVATQIRSIYTSVIKPTEGMEAAITKTNKAYKTNFKNASEMIGVLGAGKFLNRIKEATDGTTGFQEALGGRTEGLALALALTGGRAEKYNEALTEMNTNTGQMMIAHREITDGIDAQGFAWDRTKARFVRFAQRMGDKLLPVLGRLFKRFEPWLETLEKMDEKTLSWWMNWVGIHAAIGPVLAIVGSLASKMAWLTSITKASNAATMAMTASTRTMGTTMATNTGKVRGMSKAMSGLAALGIIAVGVEFAIMAKQLSEQHSEAQAEKRVKLQDALFQSRELLRNKSATPQQKIDAATMLERSAKSAATAGISAEGAAEAVLTIGSGRARAFERTMKQTQEAGVQRQRLLRSAESDVRGIRGITAARGQAAFNPLASQAVSRKIEGTQGAVSIVMGDTHVKIEANKVRDIAGFERAAAKVVNKVLTDKLSGVGGNIAASQN